MAKILNQVLTILAIIFTLFIPGYIISYIFFIKNTIDTIERFVLSFVFSVAIIPLVVFYTNMLGIRITALTVLLQVLWIVIFSVGVLIFKQLFLPKK